ncbi:MAG: hypothetical protein ACYTF1_25010, partial [Planctomycetota bacterium]
MCCNDQTHFVLYPSLSSSQVSKTALWIIILAILGAAAVTHRAEAGTFRRNRSVRLTVKDDATGRTLSDVLVYTQIGDEPRQLIGSTDGKGRLTFKLRAPRFESISIALNKRGSVPVKVVWPSIDCVPMRLTLRLTAALPIGGIVRNEAGEPISGATIELRSFRSGSSGRLDLHPYPARTDAQGRWWFDQAPDDPLSLSIRISHPDYVDKSYFIYRDAAPRKALREKTWTTMLTEGISITGVILNGKGQPIGGARIGLGGLDQELYPIVTSNKKGLFRTERVATGESFQLIAAATGRAPALIEIESEPDMDPVEFRLEPGYTIRGRVVDESGAPLPGAMIDIYRWRGQYLTLHCKARTKGAGRFELKDAPPDPVFASITRWDHQPLRDVELSPSIRPLILTLESQYRVRGRVTDAETGRPIPEFTIFKRFVDEDGEANRWYRRDRIYGALGR